MRDRHQAAAVSSVRYRYIVYIVARLTLRYLAMSLAVCPSDFMRFAVAMCSATGCVDGPKTHVVDYSCQAAQTAQHSAHQHRTLLVLEEWSTWFRASRTAMSRAQTSRRCRWRRGIRCRCGGN